jgi:hypothetical protein
MMTTRTKSLLCVVSLAERGLYVDSGKKHIFVPSGPTIGERWMPHAWKVFYKVRDAFHPFNQLASFVRLTPGELTTLQSIDPKFKIATEVKARRTQKIKRSLAAKRAWKNRR